MDVFVPGYLCSGDDQDGFFEYAGEGKLLAVLSYVACEYEAACPNVSTS